jgi:hypothetical protein
MIRTARPDLADLRAMTRHWRIRRDSEGLQCIPGRRGSVSAYDRDTLCMHVRGRRLLLGVLRLLPANWTRHQTGDDEANILAPISDLDRACRIVRAYRRPRLSEEQRSAVSARAASNFRRSPHQTRPFAGLESTMSGPTAAQPGSASETVQ